MNVVGIIAEYNPFHLGHLYHLTEAKNRVPEAAVIAVMSGSFMQRGEPALVNKWARAAMALAGGTDIVLELPVLYSVRSAYWFARGALETLQQTGLVTHLAFGAETNNLALMQKSSQLLADETPAFQASLKKALKKGLSYPKARDEALLACEVELGSASDSLSQPNNILAITYLQILHELDYPLIPLLIERKGAAYEERSLEAPGFASATAIRQRLLSADQSSQAGSALAALKEIKGLLPPCTFEILTQEFQDGRGPVSMEKLSGQIMALLRRSTKTELNSIIDVTAGLENRIIKTAEESVNLQDFLSLLKTKRYTYSRLHRFLIHLLLNYTCDLDRILTGGPPYLRLLGFSERGQELIKRLKKSATIPIITKGAHSRQHSVSDARFRSYWEKDVLATNLYSLLYPQESARKGNADFFKGPVTFGRNNF